MKKIVLWFIILVSLFLLTASSKNKSYRITDVDIIAKVNADGSMDITENRTYRFRGSYRYAFREMPLNGHVSFSNYKISEMGIDYYQSETEAPGTYQVYIDDDVEVIKWFYKARNEERTFSFSYRVDNAITRYLDVAVLYYQFISTAWGKKQGNVKVTIIPPEPGNYGSIRHWLHGPLWGQSEIDFDGKITAWTDYVPRRNYFEMRVLYPQFLFSDLPQNNDYVEGKILEEEAGWAEEANRLREEDLIRQEKRRKREELGAKILPIIAIVILALTCYLFYLYGRRNRYPDRIKVLGEIPNDIPPAFVAYLLNGRQLYGNTLASTIFDLAVRKFITLEEEQVPKRRGKFKSSYNLKLCREFMEKTRDELVDFEVELINFLFTEISGGSDSINIKDLSKKRSKFIKFFEKWKKEVSNEAKKEGWFDLDSIKGANITVVLGSITFIAFIPSIFLFGLSSFYLLGAAFVTFIFAIIIPHHTAEGRWQYDQWKAYKRFITKGKYKEQLEFEILDTINEMFVYGIVLGLSNRLYKEMAGFIPSSEYNHYLYWYHIHGTRGDSFTPDTFSKAFTTMVTTTNSTISSATGAGGGASAGGGGGASSGGGGAG